MDTEKKELLLRMAIEAGKRRSSFMAEHLVCQIIRCCTDATPYYLCEKLYNELLEKN